jgi:hypothetical protein
MKRGKKRREERSDGVVVGKRSRDSYCAHFKHPFTLVLSGSTGSGKTEWMMRFLREMHKIVDRPPTHVLYCYGELNANILQLQRMGHKTPAGEANGYETYSGVPPLEMIQRRARETGGRLLVVLDDLITSLKAADFLDPLFTKGSHNWGVSVICVTQNLFAKELRTARVNSHYLCLMRNPSGQLQIRTLAAQLYPGRVAFFLEVYRNATGEQFSYLLVDMHPTTDDEQRLKTHIYPGELCVVYVPKN